MCRIPPTHLSNKSGLDTEPAIVTKKSPPACPPPKDTARTIFSAVAASRLYKSIYGRLSWGVNGKTTVTTKIKNKSHISLINCPPPILRVVKCGRLSRSATSRQTQRNVSENQTQLNGTPTIKLSFGAPTNKTNSAKTLPLLIQWRGPRTPAFCEDRRRILGNKLLS